MKAYAVFLIALSSMISVGCSGPGMFQSAAPEQEPPTIVELAQSTESWDGESLPNYPEGQPEITILHITIPAGTRLPKHYHPVINAGVLLEGQLTVIGEDGQRLELEAGDPIIEMVNTPHYGINEGDSPAVIIVFYAGTKSSPITVPTS